MRTKVQAILQKHERAISDLQKLQGISHSQDDFSRYIKDIGGEVEKFLKDGVFSNNLNNRNFNQLINELSNRGISSQSVQHLHDLRDLYNRLKHEPSFKTDITNGIETLNKSFEALKEIKSQNLGSINDPYIQARSRIVWFAGWDDYIGGMTEIGIFLPDYELDFPVGIEYFNVDYKGWDDIKNTFISTGELKMGKEFVSDKAYKNWKNQSDFIGAGRFKGDISQLIKVISSHIDKTKEEQLLETLKRKNDSPSVRAAIVFSLYDSFINNSWTTLEDLKDEIKIRTSYDYGINIDSKIIDIYLDKLNTKITNIDRSILSSIDDIKWLDKVKYDKEEITINLIKGV